MVYLIMVYLINFELVNEFMSVHILNGHFKTNYCQASEINVTLIGYKSYLLYRHSEEVFAHLVYGTIWELITVLLRCCVQDGDCWRHYVIQLWRAPSCFSNTVVIFYANAGKRKKVFESELYKPECGYEPPMLLIM